MATIAVMSMTYGNMEIAGDLIDLQDTPDHTPVTVLFLL